VRSQAEQKSIPAPEANALSILTGRVVQTYRVLDADKIVFGERALKDFTLRVPLVLDHNNPADENMINKILKTTKFFYPTCRLDTSLPIQRQIKFTGFKDLVDFASKYGLSLE
jgi:hypothetical protein